jgi:hypothetical protein
MSGIEAAFFGAPATDAERKVSKADRPYLRFRVRVGDGEAAAWCCHALRRAGGQRRR